MSVAVPQDVQAKLNTYQGLLEKWQPKINLISNNTLSNAWQRHFEDSMQLSQHIPDGTKVIFDLGSGGGFPGLVLAMMLPEMEVNLIESDQKKCIFMKTVSRETQTSVMVHNCRIEDVSCETIPDVVMARALASLDKLFDYCHKWINANPDLTLIFPKGARADEELEVLSKHWSYDYCTRESETENEAQILIFTQVKHL